MDMLPLAYSTSMVGELDHFQVWGIANKASMNIYRHAAYGHMLSFPLDKYLKVKLLVIIFYA